MSRAVLADFCEIVAGGRKKWTGKDFVDCGFPAFGAGGLNGYLPNAEFDRPAVVLSSIGARCGKCFIAEGKWSSLANTQLIFPDPRVADPRFLWYQLNDEARWPRSGTGQPFIKTSHIKNHEVFLPPIDEQRRIAAIMDAAGTLRTKRRQALDKLDALTQAIFIDMFGDPRRATGAATVSLGEITRDRPICYGVLKPGRDVADGVPLIRIVDLQGGNVLAQGLHRIGTELDREFARSRLQGGEVLLSIQGTVGRVAICPPELAGANISRTIARIAPDDRIDVRYLASWLQLQTGRFATSGSTRASLNIGTIRNMPIPLQPRAAQLNFRQRLESVDALREQMRLSHERLVVLSKALKHRAFAGDRR